MDFFRFLLASRYGIFDQEDRTILDSINEEKKLKSYLFIVVISHV